MATCKKNSLKDLVPRDFELPVLSPVKSSWVNAYFCLTNHSAVQDFGLTFSTKVPLRFVAYLPKVPKISKKKLFDPVTASSLVMTFWVMHYIRVQNFLFTIWTYGYDIKRRRILRRFQKYKHTLVTKCT
jgi:hypothetical protein